MKTINIIVYGTKRIFTEIVSALSQSINEIGYNTNIIWYETNIDIKRIIFSDINIYIGDLRRRKLYLNKNNLNIYFCTEQYIACGRSQDRLVYEQNIDKFNVVVDMFKHNIIKPKKAIHRYCPIGYSSVFETNYNESIIESINLLHLGDMQLNNTKIDHIKDYVTPKTCFGITRDTIIQKSRINLSLQTFPNNGYEWTHLRMMINAGLRCFLMAEPHIDYGPYEPSKHFILFDPNNFIETYRYWINRPKDRKEFGVSAYDDLKQNHQYTKYVEQSLKGIL